MGMTVFEWLVLLGLALLVLVSACVASASWKIFEELKGAIDRRDGTEEERFEREIEDEKMKALDEVIHDRRK
jgi:hypothetical protein